MPTTDTAFTGVPAILRRQIKLVLASAATVLLIVLLYLLNATPIFSASTLIYVDPSNKDLLTSEGTASLSGAAENARLESEVEILRSNKVMLATIQRAALLQDPQFGPHLSRIDKLKMALGMPAPETGSGKCRPDRKSASSVRGHHDPATRSDLPNHGHGRFARPATGG